ncbi:MAG: hypothetical protein ACREQN_02245, partial [Candidatus Binataceae bacterium]
PQAYTDARATASTPARELRTFGWLTLPTARFNPGHPYSFGYTSDMSLLLNAHPRISPAFGALFNELMFAPGAFGRSEREMAAAVAAAAQDCHY